MVRFDDALHEFDTISGVAEDVTDIILNLKDIVVTSESSEPGHAAASTPAARSCVTAGDIESPADVEILNKDLAIATSTPRAASPSTSPSSRAAATRRATARPRAARSA